MNLYGLINENKQMFKNVTTINLPIDQFHLK